MGALAISNAVDKPQYDKREERYMQIVKSYNPDELKRFPEMLGMLTAGLEDEATDILGPVFHDLELHNKWAGQFFSPMPICQLMAAMTLGTELAEKMVGRGFIRAQEPASGSGAMAIALALEMKRAGFNYQQQLHMTAVDVDAKCAHMTYLQLSLLHIPAVVVHGNTLTLEEYGHWYTPAHIFGGWGLKLRRGDGPKREPIIAPPEAPVTLGQLSLF